MSLYTGFKKLSYKSDRLVNSALKLVDEAIEYVLDSNNPPKPCKRCGHCCRTELCMVAEIFINNVNSTPCPALIKEI